MTSARSTDVDDAALTAFDDVVTDSALCTLTDLGAALAALASVASLAPFALALCCRPSEDLFDDACFDAQAGAGTLAATFSNFQADGVHR